MDEPGLGSKSVCRCERVLPAGRLRLAIACGLILLAIPLGAAPLLESHDPFCAACHTQPEVDYFERSLAPAADLAATHAAAGIACIECHSGPGLAGRAESLTLGATDLAAYLSGNYAQPAVTTRPVGDVGCTKCHAQPGVATEPPAAAAALSPSHYHLAEYTTEWTFRESPIGGTCTACHPAHVVAGSPSPGFRPTLQVNASCEACHLVLSGWVPPSS
jgi:hypothetical protein